MSAPKVRVELIDALLEKYGTPAGESRASVHVCDGAKFHSPIPLMTVCVELFPGTQVWLCPTCAAKLQAFVHLYEIDPDCLNWDVLREFGNTIRLLGQAIINYRAKEQVLVAVREDVTARLRAGADD